jgi:RNA recognition motif-containing protein
MISGEQRYYIGGLSPQVRNEDLHQLFGKFGKITYAETAKNLGNR